MDIDVNQLLDRLSQQVGKLTVDCTLKDLQILNLQKELEKCKLELNKQDETKKDSHK